MVQKFKKLEWKIGSVLILIVFGFAIWAIVSLFWMGGTEKIEAVADHFKPRKDWILAKEHTEAPRSFCGDVVCPSVYRQWKTPTTPTKQELASIISEAGWILNIEGNCSANTDTSETFITTCSARGTTSDNYRVYIGVSSSKAGQESRVALGVEEDK